MSRQSKNRKHAVAKKSSKGHNAGADKHFGDHAHAPKFPHMQPKPVWARPSDRKGFWNTKKPVNSRKASNDDHARLAA